MRCRLAIVLCLALAACKDETAALPQPAEMNAETVGYFCQMTLLEHPGPKAQVHLDGLPQPLFFSQVRDAIAFQRMPEQQGHIRAIYVSDMGAAPSWEDPGATNWIDAGGAVFVVGSARDGGMGAPELVPFADPGAAAAFAATWGGESRALGAITDAEVLAPVEIGTDQPDTGDDAADFRRRLRNLSEDQNG